MIGAGRHHCSALEAERAIIDRLRDRQALIVVDEAHHLHDKLLDELHIIRDRAGCGLAQAAGRDAIEAADITAATDEGIVADECPTHRSNRFNLPVRLKGPTL